ncbi:hypothetical protein BH09MYX1_BH09MYX1_05630 [soil metagenome]
MISSMVRFTHPDRVIDAKSGATKRDLADYYLAVAERMMPHVANRPLSLLRCPSGANETCFFQKHAIPGMPPSIARSRAGDDDVVAIDSVDGLETLVQFGVVEVHPWGSHLGRTVEEPDLLVFDLDPDEALPFSRVADAALYVRDGLKTLGLESFLKTTGGKGLHVCVPIVPEMDWEPAKDCTKLVAETLASARGAKFVSTVSKRARVGKIFVDYLRNGRGATSIAPYSARAREGLTVALPIAWRDVHHVAPRDFDIRSVPAIVAKRRDPWAKMESTRQHLPHASKHARAS